MHEDVLAMICHGSVGIGSDLIGSFVHVEPYCAKVLQLLHISKTSCRIPGQNNTSRAMRIFDSGPKWFAWILSSILACMDCGIITCAPLKIRPLSIVSSSRYGQYGRSDCGTWFLPALDDCGH